MILVTGGTGLVGSHLLFELTKTQTIRATNRNSSDLSKVLEVFRYYESPEKAQLLFNNIEWVQANISNIPELSIAFKDVDYVYHCAAMVSFDPKNEKKLRKTNIEGTANIVNLCISNKVKKLCYVSSIASLSSSTQNIEITENTRWNPEENHNDYAISKYGAEIEVWRGTQEGLNAVIVNPGIIIGPGFWNSGSGELFERIDKGLSYHFPKLTGFIGVKDVTKAMIEFMQSSHKNEKIILVSENLSFEWVLKKIAASLNKPMPTKKLKKWMVVIGWIFQKIAGVFGGKQQITKDAIEGIFKKTYYSNQKAKQILGFEFQPLNQVIKDTAKLYEKDHSN